MFTTTLHGIFVYKVMQDFYHQPFQYGSPEAPRLEFEDFGQVVRLCHRELQKLAMGPDGKDGARVVLVQKKNGQGSEGPSGRSSCWDPR